MAKTRKKEVEPVGEYLGHLLNMAHMKGILKECAVVFKDGIGKINSIDDSNSVFVSCEQEVPGWDDDIEIGIVNLPMVCKYLEDFEKVNVSIVKNNLVMRGPGGTVKARLEPAEEIQGHISNDKARDSFLENATVSITPDKSKLDNLVYHIDLLKPPSLVLTVRKKRLTATTNEAQEDQFSCELGKVDDGDDEIEVEVYTEHFIHIVKQLSALKEEITLMFGPESAVVITIESGDIWALTPIQE